MVFLSITVMLWASFHWPLTAVSLVEFSADVLQSHPYIKSQALAIHHTKAGESAQKGVTDASFSLTPQRSVNNHIVQGGFTPKQVGTNRVVTSLSKGLWHWGGQVAFTSDYQHVTQQRDPFLVPINDTEFNELDLGAADYEEHHAYVSFTQPLLKNRFGKLYQWPYQMAQLSTQYKIIEVYENKESFLLAAQVTYLNWVKHAALKQTLVKQKTYLHELNALNEKKYEVHLIDYIDVLQTKEQLQLSLQEIAFTDKELMTVRATLQHLAPNVAIQNNQPVFDLHTPPNPFRRLNEKELFETHRFQQLRLKKQMMNSQLNMIQEQLKPELNLTMQVGMVQGEEQSTNQTKSNYTTSLVYVKTFAQKQLKAEQSKLKIEHQQQQLAEQTLVIELKQQYQQFVTQLAGYLDILAIGKEQIRLAEASILAEQQRFKQGKGSAAAVIQTKINREKLAQRYIENSVTYYQLYVNYLAFIDMLLTDF